MTLTTWKFCATAEVTLSPRHMCSQAADSASALCLLCCRRCMGDHRRSQAAADPAAGGSGRYGGQRVEPAVARKRRQRGICRGSGGSGGDRRDVPQRGRGAAAQQGLRVVFACALKPQHQMLQLARMAVLTGGPPPQGMRLEGLGMGRKCMLVGPHVLRSQP